MRRILVYGDSLSRGIIPGTRCAGHVEAFRAVAVEKSVFFFDMNTETTASRVDGIASTWTRTSTRGWAMVLRLWCGT